jgi:NTE family protein
MKTKHLLFRFIELFFSLFLVLGSANAQKVGLVLSGGGARGLTHIGVIKALEENNIPIDYITGTSMGAIVGSMYAMGMNTDEMITLFKSDDFKLWSTGDIDPKYVYYYRNADPKPGFADLYFDIRKIDSISFKPSFLPTNLVSPRQMNFAFVELFSQANALAHGDFNRLFVPFRCVASDIYRKEAVIFSKGNLGDAVRASMTFPFMFKPIVVNGQLLFDGGIFNNFPVDVMRSDFKPGFILGSVVSNNPGKPNENDIVKQIENMIVNKSDYTINEKEGLLLDFKLDNVNTFDFTKIDDLVQLGYNEVIKRLPEIKAKVKREVTQQELLARRDSFTNLLPELRFRKIYISGIDSLQKKYVERTFRSKNRIFDMNDFKEGYFKLISDDKISEVMPRAVYNDTTGYFDLRMRVKTKDQIKVSVGGNISSSTSNEAYFGITFQNLKDYAQTAYLDAQFGRVYNGLGIGTRVDIPSQRNWYAKLAFTLHRFDYFEGERIFYDDSRTSYFNQMEVYSKLSVGFPLTMKGRIEFGLGYGALTDRYRQSLTDQTGGLDESIYNLGSLFSKIETYTLNNIMYPIKGHHYYSNIQLAGGTETFRLNNSSQDNTDEKKNLWLQFMMKGEKYYTYSKKFVLGTMAEVDFTSRGFLNNYTATIIQAPGFTPTAHSKVAFNPYFRANQFIAAGVKPIYRINDQLHWRNELYLYVPYKTIEQQTDNSAAYSKPFNSAKFLFESTFVVDLKFASAGLFLNHYSAGVSKWNVGLNIGFLLFNNKFLE